MKFNIFKNIRKKGIFRSFLMSYIFLCIFLILLNIPFSYVLNSKYIEQSQKISNFALSESKYSFDSYFMSLQSVVRSAAFSDDIKTFSPSAVIDDNYYAQYGAFVSRLHNNATSQNENIHIVVYLPDYDLIVSDNGIYKSRLYFYTMYTKNENIYNDWLRAISSNNFFYTFDYKIGANTNQNLFYSYTSKAPVGYTGNMIFFSYIDTVFFSPKMNSIYDSTFNDLIIYSNSTNSLICRNSFFGDATKFIKNMNSKYSVVDTSVSANWKYYLVFNEKKHAQATRQITTLMIVVTLIAELIFGLLYALYFSKKYYTPIENIKNQLAVNSGGIPEKADELAFIQTRVNEIIQSGLISSDRKSIEFKALYNIIYGRYTSEDLKRMGEYFSDKEKNDFIVSLVAPDSEKISTLKNSGYTEENIQTIFTNIFEEILRINHKAIVFINNDYFCCLINGNTNNSKELIDTFNEIREIIKTYFPIDFCVSISSSIDGITNIHSCFSQSEETMHFLQMLGTKRIMEYSDLCSGMASNSDNLTVKNKLINFIKNNEPDKAYEVFDKMLDVSISNVSTSQMMEQILFNVISLFTFILSQIIPAENSMLYEKYNPVNSLLPCNTIQELKQNAKAYFTILCKLVNNDGSHDNNALEIEISKYITENYTSPDFSAVTICDKFHMQPSTLSTMFKKTFNVGMSDYITSLRLNKAKDLLKHSSKNIEDISAIVGYTNIRSFSRAFKRVEGISPGQYRSK